MFSFEKFDVWTVFVLRNEFNFDAIKGIVTSFEMDEVFKLVFWGFDQFIFIFLDVVCVGEEVSIDGLVVYIVDGLHD